jgi:Integrase core domain
MSLHTQSLAGSTIDTHESSYRKRQGSTRRECTDHMIVFNEAHLRRILSKYACYYNEVRTHLALGKDTPCTRPIERFGDIIAQPILGGLHHRYARI